MQFDIGNSRNRQKIASSISTFSNHIMSLIYWKGVDSGNVFLQESSVVISTVCIVETLPIYSKVFFQRPSTAVEMMYEAKHGTSEVQDGRVV